MRFKIRGDKMRVNKQRITTFTFCVLVNTHNLMLFGKSNGFAFKRNGTTPFENSCVYLRKLEPLPETGCCEH